MQYNSYLITSLGFEFISNTGCAALTFFVSLQTFVLHRMVKGANATILLTCAISLSLSSLIAYVGCRSLPCCGCYDARTGLVGNNIIHMNVIEKNLKLDLLHVS